MSDKYHAFHFLTTAARIHIAAWNPDDRRWEVPCGRVAAVGPPTVELDKPLCKTCAKLTTQITPAEDLEYRLA